MRPPSPEFYARHTVEVARDLLGSELHVQTAEGLIRTRIAEVEAYRGDKLEDAAAHSAAGRTARTEIMFGPPGRAYVYFIYGMYDMLNFVAEPDGTPGAVLIRGLEPLSPGWKPTDLAGPGRLTRRLNITRKQHNGLELQGPELAVYERKKGDRPRILTSPRIGISKATDLEWRFWIEGSAGVSRVPRLRPA